MRICMDHWAKLKTAIEQRGLMPLVAGSGVEAAGRMAAASRGVVTLENFEPLLQANMAILGDAIENFSSFGLDPSILFNPPDGWPECPICHLNKLAQFHDANCTNPECKFVRGQTFDGWIDRAAEDQLTRYRELVAQTKLQ